MGKTSVFALAVFGAITVAVAQPLPSFDVTSVKVNKSGAGATTLGFQRGGRFRAINEPLWRLIAEAYRKTYQLRRFEIIGIPDSIDTDRFDVEAVPIGDPTAEQRQAMLQELLADRFKLTVHREARDLPIYTLVMASADGRLGEQLHRSEVDCAALREAGTAIPTPQGQERPCVMMFGPRLLKANGMTVADLAEMGLSRHVNRPVVDQTKLTGPYQFSLQWDADAPFGVSLFTAVREQLGLKLESTHGPVEVIVVDRVEPPTPD